MSWQTDASKRRGSRWPRGVGRRPQDTRTSDPERDAETEATRLPIGAVSERTGLSARTIRYYEELDLLPGVRRRSGGRRVYGPDEVERLRFIQRLKALGLSLAEIRDLNAVYAIGGSTRAMLSHLEDLLGQRLEDLDARIGELTALRDQIEKYRAHVASRSQALAVSEEKTP